MTKVRDDQTLTKMNECIALLENEVEAGKKAFEEVLHAEIVARQTQNEQTLDKCNELHEKLSVAVATLQQAISSVTSHTEEAVEQVMNGLDLGSVVKYGTIVKSQLVQYQIFVLRS